MARSLAATRCFAAPGARPAERNVDDVRARWQRITMNRWPLFRGAGIRVRHIDDGYRSTRDELRQGYQGAVLAAEGQTVARILGVRHVRCKALRS